MTFCFVLIVKFIRIFSFSKQKGGVLFLGWARMKTSVDLYLCFFWFFILRNWMFSVSGPVPATSGEHILSLGRHAVSLDSFWLEVREPCERID